MNGRVRFLAPVVVFLGLWSGCTGNRLGPCQTGDLDCGCFANGTCSQDSDGTWLVCDNNACRRPTCVQGTVGCGCLDGYACQGGLVCSVPDGGAARCQASWCELGNLDCGCKADRTCNNDASGNALACVDGTCHVPTCTAGTDGCTCRPNYECDTGLSCQSGQCAPGTCTPGTLGCGCLADSTCSTADLQCLSGTCQTDACPAGTDGCPCGTGNLCGANLVCASGSCRSVTAPVEDTTIPLDPHCYTPCRQGSTATDGTGQYRVCTSQGLMEGCLQGQTCQQGTCVATGGTPASCTTDVDCPDFKTCIQNRCYSNCEYDSDCSEGRQCYRQVCRDRCSSAQADCGLGRSCEMVDGEHGYCMSAPDPTGDPVRTSEGSLTVTPSALAFTNTSTTGTFTIHNPTPHMVSVEVIKSMQVNYGTNGSTLVTTNPLSWVAMGELTPVAAQRMTVNIEANGSVDIKIASTANPAQLRWDGNMVVVSDRLGPARIDLAYSTHPDGQWEGRMYFYANFADGPRPDGTLAIDDWMNQRNNASVLDTVGNAFLQRWDAFKRGVLSWDEFQAVLTATQTQSWKFSNVMRQCRRDAASRRACYAYSSGTGIIEYTSDINNYSIPTGVSELPLSLNLRTPDPAAQPAVMRGKIVTDESMQFAGDPAVDLVFANAPTACTSQVGGTCLVGLQQFGATIAIGGRYQTDDTDTDCAQAAPGTFELTRTPWLVPGFLQGTTQDDSTGLRYRWECRDKTLPWGTGGGQEAMNMSFAQSNPVPDGRSRLRTLDLVDGALINQDTLFIIFRERFPSVLGTNDGTVNAYGYMVLQRAAADLDDAAYTGSRPTDTRTVPDILGVSCSDEILHGGDTPVLLPAEELGAANAQLVANAMITGQAPKVGQAAQPLDGSSTEKVHYFCEDTGLFDGGPLDNAANSFRKAECPITSRVKFFTLDNVTDLSSQACQATHACQDTLNSWQSNGTHGIRFDPVWRCTDTNQVFCDTNRLDVREGKTFFSRMDKVSSFIPLRAEIDNAFRFKTRFRNRTTGQNVGFAPVQCVPNSDAVPYCYDPPAIEEIRARVDCAMYLFSSPDYSGAIDSTTRGMLQEYLGENFAYTTTFVNGVPFTHDGFERLFAELLIMQGDEAYTKAFASRFDLAGSNMVSFEGTRFEPGGINLSGAAGYEMYNLYLAAQYYQMSLDRFYRLGPELLTLITQLGSNAGLKIVDSYFGRLIRASTQKTRAWSEVAKRYANFNQPDLARNVVRRAYASAYLESVVLSRMMLKVVAFADPADRDQIVRTAELAQLGYRAALLDMRDVFAGIKDDLNFFGMAPDYVPFPALDSGDTNAFRKLYTSAQQKLATAADKETQALTSSRSFDVDAAAFQAELTRVSNNYDNQLADVCGTFDAGDGNPPYPAIPKYSHLTEQTAIMGDPCGLVGNGRLHDAMAGMEIASLDGKSVQASLEELLGEVELERQRVGQQCGLIVQLADYEYDVAGEAANLQHAVAQARNMVSTAQRAMDKAASLAALTKCSVIGGTAVGGDCITAAIAAGGYAAAMVALEVVAGASEVVIAAKEREMAMIQAGAARWRTLSQCEAARIDSDARVKTLLLRLEGIHLESLKAAYRTRLALSDIVGLRHQATRLIAEQAESEQLTINVEAARNDPNVRIYKNDAVLTADRTFHAALRDAYRATKVYEYYTSQSYARLQNLFLIRMVASGDISLEQYMTELSDAFTAFEELYGNPDTRVAVVSLRDDILDIPRLDKYAAPLTQAQRIELMRVTLAQPSFLDGHGYLTIPFSTKLDKLSPLTRNHKVKYVEAEIVGTDVGDAVGRLYLRQKGTGTVRPVTGASLYYSFPEQTAVLNPLFNGQRVFAPEVYGNARLQERPFVNTAWELVFNQMDEVANQDVNLSSLTDIRLYIYYTDFTALGTSTP
ncbi:MAG: hypothetical protein HY904_00725 [Deltaproteobacteria bacterium]|nr:hypothetical protein [Deltaproteobacteria bacterium]